MTKKELVTKMELLLRQRGMCSIDGMLGGRIDYNSNKGTIQSAIDCLECTDELMHDYLVVVKLAYPNIYKAVAQNPYWLSDNFQRYYIFATAKGVLASKGI